MNSLYYFLQGNGSSESLGPSRAPALPASPTNPSDEEGSEDCLGRAGVLQEPSDEFGVLWAWRRACPHSGLLLVVVVLHPLVFGEVQEYLGVGGQRGASAPEPGPQPTSSSAPSRRCGHLL